MRVKLLFHTSKQRHCSAIIRDDRTQSSFRIPFQYRWICVLVKLEVSDDCYYAHVKNLKIRCLGWGNKRSAVQTIKVDQYTDTVSEIYSIPRKDTIFGWRQTYEENQLEIWVNSTGRHDGKEWEWERRTIVNSSFNDGIRWESRQKRERERLFTYYPMNINYFFVRLIINLLCKVYCNEFNFSTALLVLRPALSSHTYSLFL